MCAVNRILKLCAMILPVSCCGTCVFGFKPALLLLSLCAVHLLSFPSSFVSALLLSFGSPVLLLPFGSPVLLLSFCSLALRLSFCSSALFLLLCSLCQSVSQCVTLCLPSVSLCALRLCCGLASVGSSRST